MARTVPVDAAVVSDKIDHLELSLTRQMTDMKIDIGNRITDLAGKVQIQNGRVGRCESAIQKIEVQHTIEAAPTRLDRRQMAVIGTGGIVSGAALIELVKWIGTGLLR